MTSNDEKFDIFEKENCGSGMLASSYRDIISSACYRGKATPRMQEYVSAETARTSYANPKCWRK